MLTDVLKMGCAGFLYSSYTLFISQENRLDFSQWNKKGLHEKISGLSNQQFASIVVLPVSIIILLSLCGFLFVTSSSKTSSKQASKNPSRLVQYFSVCSTCWCVAFSFYKFMERYQKQKLNENWPNEWGLYCGLISVAIAQVCLIVYHFLRRNSLLGMEESIQTREREYERSFFKDVVHHLSNPGAFILMLPYLCLTWMFRLMPDSYYDYDKPIDWVNVLLQLLVVDFFTYVNHVTEHTIPEFHKVSHKPHHRFHNPHLFNAFDGSLVDTITLILFPLFTTAHLIHASNWDYVAFGTIYSTHFMLIHSEYKNRFDDVLSFFYVYVAEDHHVHHAYFLYNFSHFFTIYDRIGGTYREGSTCKFFKSSKLNDK